MIQQIIDVLEDLGWEPVEESEASVSYRVRYEGMTPAEGYSPVVYELYEVQLWVDEAQSYGGTAEAIQAACRLAFTHVSELLSATILTSTVADIPQDEDSDEPTVSLVFQTVEPAGSWE